MDGCSVVYHSTAQLTFHQAYSLPHFTSLMTAYHASLHMVCSFGSSNFGMMPSAPRPLCSSVQFWSTVTDVHKRSGSSPSACSHVALEWELRCNTTTRWTLATLRRRSRRRRRRRLCCCCCCCGCAVTMSSMTSERRRSSVVIQSLWARTTRLFGSMDEAARSSGGFSEPGPSTYRIWNSKAQATPKSRGTNSPNEKAREQRGLAGTSCTLDETVGILLT